MTINSRDHVLVQGFTLITALFLLVVVAALSVYMLNISSVQHTTLVYSVQGARAMQGTRSGLERGVHAAINSTNCPAATTFNTSRAGSLDNFDISVSCSFSDHTEGGELIRTFRITASAEAGTFGDGLDYVFRRLQATVSNQPPPRLWLIIVLSVNRVFSATSC